MVTESKDKKTIKLANWNVFIIDRLNQMYTKGEMCDVTLKFHDAQTIQSHKVILSACTSFFNNLPTSAAEVVLNMPKNIKSHHVRPLINFMYSGRLEYTSEEHDQVLFAAKHLGISVLTELMQVQQNPSVVQQPGMVKPAKRYGQKPNTPQQASTPRVKCESPVTQPPPDLDTTPRMLPGKKLPFWKKRKTNQVPDEIFHSVNKKPPTLELPTPTRFLCADEDVLPEVHLSEVDLNEISYESKVRVKPVNSPKPVITEDSIQQIPLTPIAPPQLTRVLKRPRVSEVVRIRDDDDDYDDGHFETIHDLDDYNEEVDPPKLSELRSHITPPKPILKTHETATPTPSKKVRFSISDKLTPANDEVKMPSTSSSESAASVPFSNSACISISAPVTSTGGQVASINHAKIINEVLKKFPHMVKNNKNIKLKIQTGGNLPVPFTPSPSPSAVPMEGVQKGQTKVQYVVLKSDLTSAAKKDLKADSIKGAENTTGPWTCVSCGDQSGPKHFESYYTYRKHLQEIHNERIDARICEHCGFKASKRNLHLYHLYTKHNIAPPRNINFPKCDQCNYIALSESLLIKHRSNHTGLVNKEYICRVCNASFKSNGALTGHMQTNLHHIEQMPKKDYECEFCGKIFNRNINLKAHIRTTHQEENRKMYEDEDRVDSPAEVKMIPEQRNQNVMEVIEVPVYDSLPNNKTFYLHQEMTILAESPAVPLMPSSESEAMNNVATGIATSINIADRNVPNDVIVINENSEIILRGTPTTYVLNPDGSYSLQEYIVPEIIGDGRQMYTTALVSSAPTTGITYVNTDNLSIITSGTDHTYADGTKLNGQVSTGSQVNLVSSNGPTVIASQVSQADPRIIVQEPIIVSGDWVQTLGGQQAQALSLGQGQKFEIISAPGVTQLNNAVQVSLPVADNTSKVADASHQVDSPPQLRTAQTLVSDWGDGDDDTQEEDSQDEDSEMKPSRPTLELAESHEPI